MHVSLLKKCFLLKVQSDILMSMDNQEIKLLVLLDLTAAFDTINHKILRDVLKTILESSALPRIGLPHIYLIKSKVFISTTGLPMILIWAVVSCKEAASAQFCLFCTFHSLIKLSSCILPMGATMTPPLRATLRQSSIMRSRSLVTLTTQLELLGESYMHIKERSKDVTPTVIAYIQKCFT